MPNKQTPKKEFPERLNVVELATFYGTSTNTCYTAIRRAQLTPDESGRYDVFAFEHAVAAHCPNLVEDRGSDAGIWRQFMKVDIERFQWRQKLQERGYDPSA